MTERSISIPSGMLKAVDNAISRALGKNRDLTGGEIRDVALEAALGWSADNPIVSEPDPKRRC